MEILLLFLMFRLQRNDGDGRITMASIDMYEHQDEGAPNSFVGFSVNSASAPFSQLMQYKYCCVRVGRLPWLKWTYL
jgi:hypothetical protein